MWAKLDDQFAEHPRIIGLTDRTFRLHVAAICHVARKLSDGHITTHDGRVLLALTRTNKRHITELIDAGIWEQNGNGWIIRDYLDYNPTGESVKERRKANADRMKDARARTRS